MIPAANLLQAWPDSCRTSCLSGWCGTHQALNTDASVCIDGLHTATGRGPAPAFPLKRAPDTAGNMASTHHSMECRAREAAPRERRKTPVRLPRPSCAPLRAVAAPGGRTHAGAGSRLRNAQASVQGENAPKLDPNSAVVPGMHGARSDDTHAPRGWCRGLAARLPRPSWASSVHVS